MKFTEIYNSPKEYTFGSIVDDSNKFVGFYITKSHNNPQDGFFENKSDFLVKASDGKMLKVVGKRLPNSLNKDEISISDHAILLSTKDIALSITPNSIKTVVGNNKKAHNVLNEPFKKEKITDKDIEADEDIDKVFIDSNKSVKEDENIENEVSEKSKKKSKRKSKD